MPRVILVMEIRLAFYCTIYCGQFFSKRIERRRLPPIYLADRPWMVRSVCSNCHSLVTPRIPIRTLFFCSLYITAVGGRNLFSTPKNNEVEKKLGT
jgi:hypothetical protein